MSTYTALVDQLRRTFNSGKTRSLEFRKFQIRNLKRLFEENKDELCDAIHKDLKRSKIQSLCYEINSGITECDSAIANLEAWMEPQKVRRQIDYMMDEAMIVHDPLGVVLIMSAWNYPVHLMFQPFVAALAAGNCVVLKPSEVAASVAHTVARLVPKYFSSDTVQVVCGGVKETTDLLEQKFDHILYTGSSAVGKIVMAAASKHLTPVTLELGGKSPAIIDDDCNLSVAARRLAWGKWINSGQTCVAPDYVLCTEKTKTELVESLKKLVNEFYGSDASQCADYTRIINERHFDRIVSMLNETVGTVAVGGKHKRDDLFIEPTVLENVKPNDAFMQQEIFGPVLPIITVNNLSEAFEFINSGEKPLASYLFTNDQHNAQRMLNETSSGGVTINDCMLHMTVDTLPFGGVGNSGMGSYHGKFGFETFSHKKAVLHRSFKGESFMWMRYPPYDQKKSKLMDGFTRKKRSLPDIDRYIVPITLVLGVILGIIIQSYL